MSHDGLIHPAKDCAEQIAALKAQVQTLREAMELLRELAPSMVAAALAATEEKE